MKKLLCLPLLLLTACAQPADSSCEGLQISEAWIREMPPGPQVTAGYFLVNNSSEQDIVVNHFSSPDFERVELHETLHEDGQMRMRQMHELTVPATEGLALQPHGWHLMLFNPSQRPTAGQTLSIQLHCGSDVANTRAEVRKGGPAHHEHHGHH